MIGISFFIEQWTKKILLSNKNSGITIDHDSIEYRETKKKKGETRRDRRGLSASPLIDAVSPRRATSLNESVCRKQYVSSSYPRERPSLPWIPMDQFSWIVSAARRAGHVSTMHVRVRGSAWKRGFPRGQPRYQTIWTTFERAALEPEDSAWIARGIKTLYDEERSSIRGQI